MSRPRTRKDCPSGPCPYVSCRHHLFLDVTNRTTLSTVGALSLHIKANAEVAEAWEDALVERILEAKDTCSLNVANRGSNTLGQVASALGVTRERARQMEVEALKRMKTKRSKSLRVLGWTL